MESGPPVERHLIEMRRAKLIFTMSLPDEASLARKISPFLTVQQFSSTLPDGLLFAESVILLPWRDSDMEWPRRLCAARARNRSETTDSTAASPIAPAELPSPSAILSFLARGTIHGNAHPYDGADVSKNTWLALPLGCKKTPFLRSWGVGLWEKAVYV